MNSRNLKTEEFVAQDVVEDAYFWEVKHISKSIIEKGTTRCEPLSLQSQMGKIMKKEQRMMHIF